MYLVLRDLADELGHGGGAGGRRCRRCVVLTGAGTLAYLLPMSAIAGIGILLRNSAAAVVGTLMVSPGRASCKATDWEPIVRSAWVCALHAVPAAFWALTVFLRRDVTGG